MYAVSRFLGRGGLILLALAWAAPAQSADELEKSLTKAAPQVLAKLKEAGYQNVGVLKFRVKKGNEPPSDRVGAINMRLADKLELALILANKVREPIGIIRKASSTAAQIPGASHLTAEGRRKLFAAEYPLAWGNQQVRPDAFVTGVAVISPDFRNMTVGILAFDNTGGALQKLAQFDCPPDLEDLLDIGESFTLRGVFDAGEVQLTETERKEKATQEAVQAALQVKKETQSSTQPVKSTLHPLSPNNTQAPVRLEIRYDGKPQTIEFRGGEAFVPEPREGQKVTLVVRRSGTARPRLGVVLKVNGENTLQRETLPDAQCRMWILEPHLTEFGIRGYQMSDKTMQEFKVLSQEESASREIDYGEHVGAISITVFQEQTTKPLPDLITLEDEGEDFAILSRGVFPAERPATLGALKAQLSPVATRGLIAEGAQVDQTIETVKFQRDPTPLMTATVRYYSPQDLPE